MQPKALPFVLIGFLACNASAWGPEGHQTIAEIARNLLTPEARTKVSAILHHDNLAAIATWADEVRAAGRGKGPLVDDQEAAAFNDAFPDNDKWHFVNLPLGTTNYNRKGPFSSPDDVVHTIVRCIAVLEGTSQEFSDSQALKLLVHFVGDIHQPLHVGTGYYATHNDSVPLLVTDPGEASHKADDEGGNKLFYNTGRFDELHAYWDGYLVGHVAHTTTYHKLAPYLSNKVEKVAWKNKGDYHAWPDQWASESVHLAQKAYEGLDFHSAEFNTHHGLRKIVVSMPSDYADKNIPRVAEQLAKGGYHLAELLNAIHWK
jgi:hypothetical protein